MRRHEEPQPVEEARKIPLSTRLKLASGAAAAAVAMVFANGCGSNGQEHSRKVGEGIEKYNPQTEAKLGSVIRPAMVNTAKATIRLSKDYPELSFKTVSDKTIELYISGREGQKINDRARHAGAGLLLVTRRQGESETPNPNAAIYEDVYYVSGVEGNPDRNYSDDFTFQAPRVSKLLDGIAAGSFHPLGWSASEDFAYGPKRNSSNQYFYETDDPENFPGYGTPVSTASTIMHGTPNTLHLIESQLGAMRSTR